MSSQPIKLGGTVKITGWHIYQGETGEVIKDEGAYYQVRLQRGGVVCVAKEQVECFDERARQA